MKGVYALVLAACISLLSFLVYVAIKSTRAECMPGSHEFCKIFNRENPLLRSFRFTEDALWVGRQKYLLEEIESIELLTPATYKAYGVVEVRLKSSKRMTLYFMAKDHPALKQAVNRVASKQLQLFKNINI